MIPLPVGLVVHSRAYPRGHPALTISGKLMRIGNRPVWAMDGVRVLELDRNCPITIGQRDCLEDQSERVGLEDGEVAALLSLPGSPTQELSGVGIVAGSDCIFDIGVSTRFVQFMIERRHDILPGGVEDRDAVGGSIRSSLGKDTHGVVDGMGSTSALGHMDRPVIAAQSMQRVELVL